MLDTVTGFLPVCIIIIVYRKEIVNCYLKIFKFLELGFSKRDRDQNIARIAFVSAELTKSGAAVIAAPIAPFAEARAQARAQVESYGGFYLVRVNTPLDYCIRTDRKGIYKVTF